MRTIEEISTLSDEELMEQIKAACKRIMLAPHIRFGGCIPPSIKDKIDNEVNEIANKIKSEIRV